MRNNNRKLTLNAKKKFKIEKKSSSLLAASVPGVTTTIRDKMPILIFKISIVNPLTRLIFESYLNQIIFFCHFKHFYLTFFKYKTMPWRKVILNFLTLEISVKAI